VEDGFHRAVATDVLSVLAVRSSGRIEDQVLPAAKGLDALFNDAADIRRRGRPRRCQVRDLQHVDPPGQSPDQEPVHLVAVRQGANAERAVQPGEKDDRIDQGRVVG
jgi:hypothetical protein